MTEIYPKLFYITRYEGNLALYIYDYGLNDKLKRNINRCLTRRNQLYYQADIDYEDEEDKFNFRFSSYWITEIEWAKQYVQIKTLLMEDGYVPANHSL